MWTAPLAAEAPGAADEGYLATHYGKPWEAIEAVNRRYFIVRNLGGKAVVGIFASNECGELHFTHQTQHDFMVAMANRTVGVQGADGVTKNMPLGRYWWQHEDRREYQGVRLDPRGVPNGYLNLWRGFTVKPVAGEWGRMQRHIFEVIANGNREHAEWIIRWIAWVLQNPGDVAEVALVLRGPWRCGKGILLWAIREIFGVRGMQTSKQDLITGRFLEHLRDCCFLYADEAYWPGGKAQESTFKNLITEPTQVIEGKGLKAEQIRNHLSIAMSANEEWVVPHAPGRFAMFDVSGKHVGDPAYFAALATELANGGLGAILHDLLAMDLTGWRPGRVDIPQTRALADQHRLSLKAIDAWWTECLEAGYLGCEIGQATGLLDANKGALVSFTALLESAEGYGHGYNTVTQPVLTSHLISIGALRERPRLPNGGRAGRLWRIPPLAECRANWRAAGKPGEWADTGEDWA
jgi:Family of unknown function (DUF5906)